VPGLLGSTASGDNDAAPVKVPPVCSRVIWPAYSQGPVVEAETFHDPVTTAATHAARQPATTRVEMAIKRTRTDFMLVLFPDMELQGGPGAYRTA